MTLVMILLGTFLLLGQVVRRWSVPLVLGLTVWIVFVVGIHLAFLR